MEGVVVPGKAPISKVPSKALRDPAQASFAELDLALCCRRASSSSEPSGNSV